jgi:predicted TIM-barrel fold metal-dependent hydrolase
MHEISRRTLLHVVAMRGAAMSPFAADYRIVDPHVHVWKHDPKYPFAEGARVPDRDATPEMLLDLMSANGVSKTVLIQVIHYKYDNRYLMDVLKQNPWKFQGVCRVDPLDAAAPDHLSRLTAEGFRGVRLSPAGNASGDWFRGPLMPPLWKRCSQLKVPMTVLAPITRMPDVALLLEKTPDLTVVIDHMADCPIDQPTELEKLIALKRYPNVFVKISHTWVHFKAALSMAGCTGICTAAISRVRPAAPHVGHRLAHRRGLFPLCESSHRGPGRNALSELGRPALDARPDRGASLVISTLMNIIFPADIRVWDE